MVEVVRFQRRRSRVVFLSAFALLAMLSTLWALASPVFSVPDENAHATKAIAQVRGQVIGYHVPGVKHTVVDLPAGYSYSPQVLCFAFHPDKPANCGVELGDATGTPWFNTWVGAYNPLYYYAVGWPSLIFEGSAGIYAMRIVSGILCSWFVAWAFQAAMSVRRTRWLPLGLAFAAAPMGVYLFGAVNPNGMEIAASLTLWVALLRLLQQFDGRDPGTVSTLPRRYLWFLVTVSAIALATARALGPLWLVIVVGICFVACGWLPVKRLFTTASSYLWLAVVAAGSLFSIFWTLGGGSLSSQAEKSDAPLVGASFLQGFAYVLRNTPDFVQQAIGYFGWFDAPLPAYVYWLLIAAISLVVVLAFAVAGKRNLMTLLTVTSAAILVPAFLQGYSVAQTGIIWQGRYGLFLYLGVLVIAVMILSSAEGERLSFISTRVTWIAAGLIVLYGIAAFFLVLLRYVVGTDVPVSTMWKNPTWEPPLGWMTLVALYALTSVALAVWVGLLATRAARSEDDGAVVASAPAVVREHA
ncbi:DUF2142 domain-containing protein [Cryobacterium mannosilyticum]|uniref:DUF2142 domain-containing protein n=1 Tax=Cryobacterium mannosilyticum TaxID=1259190 RepID=A0A4R8W6G6_9MICO|nr:DUF2142 domain-containing protein [Cryobacterium mannosilyticum]